MSILCLVIYILWEGCQPLRYHNYCINRSFEFQVKRLLALCPKESGNGIYRLDHRNQGAVIALGIYFLESDLQVSI